jgi:ArsR family transcriptional regulator
MQALEISQSKASRGLSALYDAGFLKMRKNGLWSLYSINDKEIKDYLTQLILAVKESLEGNEQASQDIERLKRSVRVGPGCRKGVNIE